MNIGLVTCLLAVAMLSDGTAAFTAGGRSCEPGCRHERDLKANDPQGLGCKEKQPSCCKDQADGYGNAFAGRCIVGKTVDSKESCDVLEFQSKKQFREFKRYFNHYEIAQEYYDSFAVNGGDKCIKLDGNYMIDRWQESSCTGDRWLYLCEIHCDDIPYPAIQKQRCQL